MAFSLEYNAEIPQFEVFGFQFSVNAEAFSRELKLILIVKAVSRKLKTENYALRRNASYKAIPAAVDRFRHRSP